MKEAIFVMMMNVEWRTCGLDAAFDLYKKALLVFQK